MDETTSLRKIHQEAIRETLKTIHSLAVRCNCHMGDTGRGVELQGLADALSALTTQQCRDAIASLDGAL
jgi:hypothetical protein